VAGSLAALTHGSIGEDGASLGRADPGGMGVWPVCRTVAQDGMNERKIQMRWERAQERAPHKKTFLPPTFSV
jgi:hypothetical protein